MIEDLRPVARNFARLSDASCSRRIQCETGQVHAIPTPSVTSYLVRQLVSRRRLEEAYSRDSFARAANGSTAERKREVLTTIVRDPITLRRVEALIILHRLLKAWPFHVLTTALMLALLVIHLSRSFISRLGNQMASDFQIIRNTSLIPCSSRATDSPVGSLAMTLC